MAIRKVISRTILDDSIVSEDLKGGSNLPSVRPALLLDFVNGTERQSQSQWLAADARLSISRRSYGTHFSGAKHYVGGINIIPYSNAFADANWSKQGGSVSTTTAVAAPYVQDDGTAATVWKFTEDSSTQAHRIYIGWSAVSGQTYTYSVYMKMINRRYVQWNCDNQRGGARVVFDLQAGSVTQTRLAGTMSYTDSKYSETGVNAGMQAVGNGWYRCWVKIVASNSSGTCPIGGSSSSTGNGESYAGSGTDAFYVCGFQVEQGDQLGAYTDTGSTGTTKYNPKYAPSMITTNGEPRIAVDPITGERLGLMLEGSSINLFPSALYPENAMALSYVTAYPEVTPSPMPGVFASRWVASAGTFAARGTVGVNPWYNGTFTFSTYAKSAGDRYARIHIWNSGEGTKGIGVDFQTGTLLNIDNVLRSGIEPVGNGWYRIWFSATVGNYSYTPFMLYPGNPADASATFDGVKGTYFWGTQVEQAPYPSSVILTFNSQQTRADDKCYISNIYLPKIITNQDKNTVYIEWASVGNNQPAWSLQNTAHSTNNHITVSSTGANNGTWSFFSTNIGNSNGSANGPTIDKAYPRGPFTKLAIALEDGNAAYSTNGAASTAITGYNTTPQFDRLCLGSTYFVTSTNVYIKKLSIYPDRLINSQLEALTK